MFVVVTRLHSTKTKQETVANVAFPVGAPMAVDVAALVRISFKPNKLLKFSVFFLLCSVLACCYRCK